MRPLILSFLIAAPLAAQQASPYIPIGHWAMPYVEQLVSARVIEDPTPLMRPLKRSDVVRALRAADTTTAPAAVRGTVRRLLAEFETEEQRPYYHGEATIGIAAANFARRDPVRADSASHTYFNGGVDFYGVFGPVVALTHPTFDTRLQFDPDWSDFGKSDNASRFQEAYLSGQWRYGEVFFGTLDRNWGPSGIQGVLLSDNPYTLAYLAVTVGTPRFQVQGLATQLDTRTDATGALVNRYLVARRLYVRPKGRWTAVVWEGSVLSGVGRQLEPWYLNIAQMGLVLTANTKTNVNVLAGIDFERRAAVTLFGQFMLDDIQVSRRIPTDEKPASYAFTVGAKGRAPHKAASWMAYYTQVANLTYRNEDDLQVPLYHLLGTGRNYADYDQATAKLSVLARSGLLLEPEVTLLRQGQGDPRQPHPLVSAYTTTATLFQGVVERTVRFALGGSYQHGGWSITGNGGVHLVHNAGHVTGTNTTRWIGRVGITYRFHREGAF